jgi:two-component system NtrC family sensor kinase
MTIDVQRSDVTSRLHGQVELERRLQAAHCLEDAAQAACDYFYDGLVEATESGGRRTCALVRCFISLPYGRLEPALQRHARSLMPPGSMPRHDMPCITLVGSMGDRPEWQSRHGSYRRRCIPFESPRAVERAPMWSQFFRESGVEATSLFTSRSSMFADGLARATNLFCIEQARGAACIPDQADFVLRHGIESVFGFASHLRRGALGVLVLFCHTRVTREAAMHVRPLALDLASHLFRFGDDEVFASGSAPTGTHPIAPPARNGDVPRA